ncbi:MAG: hypothetical protein VX589_13805 [Myxococcota bacterium]|nr:hypothetical protein [Myxococcota bacterium]
MVGYTDRRIQVDETGITIRGLPIPKLSRLQCQWEELARIEEVPIGLLRRLWLMGPGTSRTWWAFDPFRPLKGRALIIYMVTGVGPFDRVGVTVSDTNAALSAIESYASNLVESRIDNDV